MPFLLYTYLATEVLAPFFASLLILGSILFLGRLMPTLDVILGFGIGFADFIRLSAYLAPKLLLFAMPMASMIGVIIAFNRMTGDNEIIALKASGIGLYRMLPPVIVFALATAAATALISTTLIPAGTHATQQLLIQLAKEKIDKGLREKEFSESLGKLVLYADRVDPESKKWQGVYVSDLRNPKTPITILARSGSLTARLDAMEITLELVDGSLHRAPDQRSQTIQFRNYTVRMPLEDPQTVLGEPADALDKGSLGLAELRREAHRQGIDTPVGASLLIEFHKRLALPVGCFILSLLGLPLALFTRHGRRPLGLPLGLAFFILYYVLLTGTTGVGESSAIPLAHLVWLPNLLFAVITLFFIRRVAREQASPALERFFALGDSLFDRLPWHRRRGGGA
ncbi:MAG: LPS export ABC transporter permease LptF [Desulfobulbaceae bacterium]|nr:LPS export ABC transporter permease LptF [Desulfobulbaceae bacterium]